MFGPVIAAFSYFEILLLMPVTLVHTGPIFESIDEARDVIRSDGNDEGICYDSHDSNSLQDTMPDT